MADNTCKKFITHYFYIILVIRRKNETAKVVAPSIKLVVFLDD
jgi:hypothetical protein